MESLHAKSRLTASLPLLRFFQAFKDFKFCSAGGWFDWWFWSGLEDSIKNSQRIMGVYEEQVREDGWSLEKTLQFFLWWIFLMSWFSTPQIIDPTISVDVGITFEQFHNLFLIWWAIRRKQSKQLTINVAILWSWTCNCFMDWTNSWKISHRTCLDKNLNVNGFTPCRESTMDGPSLWKKIRCCGCVRFQPVSILYDYDWLHLFNLKFHKMDPIICTDPKHFSCCQGLGGCSWQEQVISTVHGMECPWKKHQAKPSVLFFHAEKAQQRSKFWCGWVVWPHTSPERPFISILVAKNDVSFSVMNKPMNGNFFIYHFSVFASLVSFGNCLSPPLWFSLPMWWCNDRADG